MRKLWLALVFIGFPLHANPILYRTSRSFLFPRPIYQNIPAVQNLWSNPNVQKEPVCAAAQVTGLFQQSRHNKRLASYFLLNCQECISIIGDDAQGAAKRNVRAEWLNLPSDFSGLLILNPKQEQAACVLEYSHDLKVWFDWLQLQHLWIDVQAPIVIVKNNLRPTQITLQAGTPLQGQPDTILAALNQPKWHFAKIDRTTKSKTALAELRCTLGTTLVRNDNFDASIYMALIIPTAKKQRAEFIFNPFVGINGHLGLVGGFCFETPVLPWNERPYALTFFFHIEGYYYWHNIQCRTFDLRRPIDRGCSCSDAISDCSPPYDPDYGLPLPDILPIELDCQDKQWSRYLMLRRPGQIGTVPGVNILTQRVRVFPHMTVDLSLGFRALYANVQLEIGYDLWARSAEQLELIKPSCETALFNFQHFGIAGRTPGRSASTSTINHQGPDDPEFVTIRQRDISLASGAYAGGSTNRAHVNLTYLGIGNCFAGAGFYYEVPNRGRNTVFEDWGIWVNLGTAF